MAHQTNSRGVEFGITQALKVGCYNRYSVVLFSCNDEPLTLSLLKIVRGLIEYGSSPIIPNKSRYGGHVEFFILKQGSLGFYTWTYVVSDLHERTSRCH